MEGGKPSCFVIVRFTFFHLFKPPVENYDNAFNRHGL